MVQVFEVMYVKENPAYCLTHWPLGDVAEIFKS